MFATTAYQNENADALARLYAQKYRLYREDTLSVMAQIVIASQLFGPFKSAYFHDAEQATAHK